MRITESQLRRYIRQTLLEQVIGNQAFVYHGSELPPDDFIDMMESNTFEPGRGAGAMYGKGLYTVYDPDPNSPTFTGQYGNNIYRIKVNLSGFLIFDSGACVKVHGKKMSLADQLKKLGMQNELEKIKWWWPDTYHSNDNYVPYKKAFEDEDLSASFGYTSDIAYTLSPKLKNRVAGMIFTGRKDGKVCVIYDPSTCVVVSHSNVLDRGAASDDKGVQNIGGKVFRSVTPGKEQIHRSATSSPDPTRYAPNAKKSIEIMVKAIEDNGFKVDRSKISTISNVEMNDSLLGGPPPADIQWWETATEFYDALYLDNGITPEPTRKDEKKIIKAAFKAAFYPNTEEYLVP
jgi:hypothetical protein